MSDQICEVCSCNVNETEASWCCNCGVTVCAPCADSHQQLSPPHEVVSLALIRNSSLDIWSLPECCPCHSKETVTYFCCQHDDLLCESCISENHNNCGPILSFEKAAENVKTGTALPDLERRLTNLIKLLAHNLVVMEGCRKSQIEAKSKVIEKVSEIKEHIITHLDNIETALLSDIDNMYEKHSSRLSQFRITQSIPLTDGQKA